MKKNAKTLLILFEMIVCCCLIAAIMIQNKREPAELSMTDWQSDYIQYDSDWYVDDSLLDTNIEIDLLNGPYVELKRGTYTATVDYHTDFEQKCELSAEDEERAYIRAGTNKLVRNQNRISFRFTLTEDVDSLEVLIKYDGQGSLRIQNIEIRPDSVGMRRIFVCIVLLFVLLDLFVYFAEQIREHRNIVFAAAGMVFMISLPLFMHGITDGHDLSVHFMRIEGIADEIRNGNLPVRISSLWMDGHGYPISVYYGDLLLYIPAVLRIVGFSIVAAYKIYVFLINAATVVIAYGCFKKIFSKAETACVVTLAYVTASYRFVDVYVRAAVGEYSAMMFLPVIALALYGMYTEEESGWNQECKNALFLALGMTGLIGTHILSTQMVVLVLVIVCILLWKKTVRKNTLRSYVLAVLETVILNLYFIIPFLDYYLNVSVNINGTVDDEVKNIQSSGTYIGQYFAFFQNSFGLDGEEISGRLGLSPGIVLMLALLLALVLWVNQKASKEVKYLTVLSVMMLFVASDLFPWNHLAANYAFGSLLSQVQFPWRYISIAVIFLAMLLGYIFQYYSEAGKTVILEKLYLFTVALCMISSFYFVSDYSDNASMVFYYDTPELNTYAVGGAEYLRQDTDWVLFPNEISQENMKTVSQISRKGYRMELFCETAEEKGTVQVPLFHYKGYRVTDEYGNDYKITDGKYNFIKFTVPAGYSGNITIDFVEPWYWRMGEVISLLFAVCLCISGILGRFPIAKVSGVFKKEGEKK